MAGLYLDTSCFLKLFFPEPETSRVLELAGREEQIVVSTLARLEVLVQVQARVATRLLSARAATALIARMDGVLRRKPYELVACPPGIIEIAESQIRPVAKSTYCRTLDRLHLATMQGLGLRRLLTNDDVQARAARVLRFEVGSPR